MYKAPPDHCCKKCSRDTDINQHCHHWNHCLHNVIPNQCYLNLPEDMVEDNPLDIKNIKEKMRTMNFNSQQQDTLGGTIARHLAMLTMYCATPNQVMIHPIGK